MQFSLRYLKGELFHRLGKTVTVSLGLAVAGAIIISIIAVSQSLSSAQTTVLNPLQNVGTDILLTRSLNPESLGTLDEATRTEALKDNRIMTDFAKLGKPGDQFSTDSFLPGTMLTFATTDITSLDTSVIADTAAGLVLNVVHQEGKIPQLTAEFQTGGERIAFRQELPQMTDAEQKALDAARQKAIADLQKKGIDPNSDAGRKAIRDATNAAMPDRLKAVVGEVVTPQRTFRQDIGSFSMDIQTENFTLAGVDTSKPTIGLILPDQIVEGRYLQHVQEIIFSQSFAEKRQKKVGDTFSLAGKDFTIVGLVVPKLYTMTADAYVSIVDAQTLAGLDGRINVLLVKATSATNVPAAGTTVAALVTGAKITDASETAKQVTGSLVNATNLTQRFIGLTSIIIILASLAIVSLITVLSVNKRIREIGTLKAIGWGNAAIVRQIIMENIVLGLLGAAIAVGLGLLGLMMVNRLNISLSATFAASDAGLDMVRRFLGGEKADLTTNVQLHVAASTATLLLGAGVALLGAVVAGAFAALKSSRMKPQEALRNIE